MKCYAHSRYSLGEISEKPSWKLENMVATIYKTISNINIVFLNLLTNQTHICNFFYHGWCFGIKSDHICQLKKIHFPKISDQAPLRMMSGLSRLALQDLNGTLIYNYVVPSINAVSANIKHSRYLLLVNPLLWLKGCM